MDEDILHMDIERIGENKIRCALTEEEIQKLGFDVDEIIGDSEMTQRFMQEVLYMVEQQEDIDMKHVTPVVKAELLPDHSMAITFGAEADTAYQDLVDTVSNIMSQIDPEKLEELKKLGRKEKKAAGEKRRQEPMICALQFASLEYMHRMSLVCFPDKVPKSSLYRLDGSYYLILDFTGFSKDEMRPFAFGAVEYDDGHYSDAGQIAHIKEMGHCIMKSEAVETLMQL